MAWLSELVATEYGYDSVKARQIRSAAALHDIGKVRIPDSILNKPGKLTAQEFEIIKTHTELGAVMLSSIQGELGDLARNICRLHHEKWDGSGYLGIRSGTLPAYISVVTVCDIFTALVVRRPYKEPWPPSEAIDYIINHAGTLFNPELVKVFVSLIRNDSRVPAIFSEVIM